MNNRDKVFIELSKSDDIAQIAEKLDLTYSTIIKYKKEYEQAELEGKLDLILSQDAVLIEQIAEELPGDATQLVKSLKGLDKLNNNMQITAELLVVKLKTLISNVGPDDSDKLLVCSRILCELHGAFNKQAVNVNVQNNNFDSSRSTYGEFLSDKPPIN